MTTALQTPVRPLDPHPDAVDVAPTTRHRAEPSTRPVLGTTTGRRLLYLTSALPLGAVWLAVLIAGWVVVPVLAITPLLPAVLIGFAAVVRFSVWVEGFLARRLLGAPVAPRRLATERRGYWASVPGTLGDRRFWTGQAFLALRAVLGLVTATVVLAVLAAGLEGVLAPLIYRFIPTDDTHGIDFGVWLVDTLPESLLLVPVGFVLLAAGIGLAHVAASAWRSLAVGLLGGQDV